MPSLLIDASTTTLFVGAFDDKSDKNGAWLKLLTKESGAQMSIQAGALEGLFDLAGELFKQFPLEGFDKIILCEGPGRLMSLRVAAVAANEWSSPNKEKVRMRFIFNSLQLASLVLQKPAAIELRTGTFATWNNNKTEILSALPPGVSITTASDYAQAIQKFPAIVAKEKILTPTEFFAPPLFAPNEYSLAKIGAISRDSSQNL